MAKNPLRSVTLHPTLIRSARAILLMVVLVMEPVVFGANAGIAGLAGFSGKAGIGNGPAAAAGGTVSTDSSAKGAANAATLTIAVASHTVRRLYVAVATGANDVGDRTVTSVASDLDGAVTHLAADSDDANFLRVEWWTLSNPTVGTHTITASTPGAVKQVFAVSVYSSSGTINTGTASVNSNTGTASGSASVTLASGDLALGGVCSDANATIAFTTGSELQEQEGISSDVCASLGSNTGTGSVAIAFTGSTPDNGWAISVIPVSNTP
jgi:hypothetical protein